MAHIHCPQCKAKTNDLLSPYCRCGYQLDKLTDKLESARLVNTESQIRKDIDINNNISNAADCFRGIGKKLFVIIIMNLVTALVSLSSLISEKLLLPFFGLYAIISLLLLLLIAASFFDASKYISKIRIY
jgi:hypothetical protein